MSSDRVLEILSRYDSALVGAEDATLARINAALEQSYRQLEQRLLRAYSTHSENQSLLPKQRSLLVLEEVKQYLLLLNPSNQQQIQRDFEGLLRASWDSGLKLSDELTQAIANEQLQSFAAVPLEAVRLQAEQSAQRLYRWAETMRDRISGVVEGNLVLGSGPRKVEASLRQELGILKGRAEMIARTESLASLNAAAQTNYRRNGIEQVQMIATADDRTCRLCVARNGNVYEIGQITVPSHPRCRCALSPWKKEWQELGLTNDAWMASFREEAIAQLPEGTSLDFGPSPFEKAAGATRAPEPVWRPGQREERPSPAPSATRLPTNHAISASPRISTEALDRALDALQTPGATERVELLRRFIDRQGIQAIFWDEKLSVDRQRAVNRDSLAYQRWVDQILKADRTLSRDQVFQERTEPLQGAGGYTFASARHVFVDLPTGRRRGQGETFAVRPERINAVAEEVLSADPDKLPWAFTYWSKDRTSDEEAFLAWIHELGHQVHFAVDRIKPPPGMAIDVATKYGDQDDDEWFAEHFSLWLLDAERYAAVSPENAKWIGEQVQRAARRERRLK